MSLSERVFCHDLRLVSNLIVTPSGYQDIAITVFLHDVLACSLTLVYQYNYLNKLLN